MQAREVFNWGPSGVGGDTGRSRARREKQDEYRKALDAQIEERRSRDKTLRDSRQPTNTHTVPEKAHTDPVGHLMPWVKDKGSPPEFSKPTAHVEQQQQQQPTHYHHHQQQQQMQQPGSSYPYGSAEASSFYSSVPPPSANSQYLPQGQNPQVFQHPQSYPHTLHQNQFHPHQNVAYGYYPSPQVIPPPPNYVPSVYLPYGSPPQMHPQQQQQQQQQQEVLQALPPPPSLAMESHDGQKESAAVDKFFDKASSEPADASKKPHVSQSYEEMVAAQGTDKDKMDDYRLMLEKQLEEKRKIDDERHANEKKIDEMLWKRDAMIIQREKDEIEMERRSRYEKEAERLRKGEEAAKAIEEQMKVAKQLKEAKREAKKKELEAELELRLKYEDAGEQIKPLSNYFTENPHDSTPVPTLVMKNTSTEGREIDIGGSGDNNMSIIGTFQSNNNNSNHGNPSSGNHCKKKFVEDSVHLGSNSNEDFSKKGILNSSASPSKEILVAQEPTKDPAKEVKPQSTPTRPIRHRGAETYRKRNAHTSIIDTNGEVMEKYMYVPISPVSRRKNEELKVQQRVSVGPTTSTTPPTKGGVYSSLQADGAAAKTCPNCRHAFSGNSVIETQDQSTETDDNFSHLPITQPRQPQLQNHEFLMKLQSILKDDSAQIKQEMAETDKEILEYDDKVPTFCFNSPVTQNPKLTSRIIRNESQ